MLANLLPSLVNLVGAAALGALGWAYLLQGRVSRLEGQYETLTCLIKTRFDAIDKRLDRVERSLNGYLKH